MARHHFRVMIDTTARRRANRPRAGLLPAWFRTSSFLAPLVLLPACQLPTGLPGIESTFRFPVEDVVVPVTGTDASAFESADFDGIDIENVSRGKVLVTPENTEGAMGVLAVRLVGGGVTVAGSIDIAGGADQPIDLSGEEARALLGGPVMIEATGTLCRASGCGFTPPPFPNVRLRNAVELVVRLGGKEQVP